MMDRVELPDDVTVLAPDGSEVRVLAAGTSGTMAHFRLNAGQVSVAVAHRTIEELWYFVKGKGEMCIGDEVCDVHPGVSVRIPPHTRFQFRCTGDELEAVAVTMPPWPGPDEAVEADPFWTD